MEGTGLRLQPSVPAPQRQTDWDERHSPQAQAWDRPHHNVWQIVKLKARLRSLDGC
jgi:hypothetical protein